MSKCYFAHGGNELVIGGKLTFLPGASVEGGEGLAQLREDYNRLLSVLRDAGIIAPLQEVIPDDRDG